MNRKKQSVWILVVVWLLATVRASCQQQPEGYRLQHFTDENGLPQNSVKSIAQDGNGFIWLTTEAGLVRFDGRRFVTFEKSVLPIANNRFRAFVPFPENSHGRYPEFFALSEKNEYVGILQNGLAAVDTAFDIHYRRFNPLARGKVRYNEILASIPAQHAVDPDFEHYLATSVNGISYLWRNPHITAFRQGRRLFTANGAFKQFVLIGTHPYATNAQGAIQSIGTVVKDVVIEGDILHNRLFSANRHGYRLYWNNISRQAFLYLDQTLYIARSIAPGKLVTQRILEDFDFEKYKVNAVLFDANSGSLFLGSKINGLYLLKKQEFFANKVLEDNADNVYYAQAPGPGLSVVTSQGHFFKARNGSSKAAAATRLSALLEKTGTKFFMARCPDGSFWFQNGGDLYKTDQLGQQVLARIQLPEKARTLDIEPDGKLWVGCETNAFFSVEEINGRHLVRLRFRLRINDYSIIGRENRETIFLASEQALYRLNTRTGSLKIVEGVKNMTVRYTYTTGDGTWLATYGNGLFLLKDRKVISFPLDDDRFLATAHCIVEDRKGFFWITTNRGLFQVAKKQLLDYAANNRNLVYYLFYDKSNGFATNEFNGGCRPCALTLADGTVSLPSIDGLIWFKPETIKAALPDRKIFVSGIQEDSRVIPVADTLALSNGFGQLRLTVTTPYLGNAKNIRMDYALSGSDRDDEWKPVDPDFTISLPGLGHGSYALKIRNVSGFGSDDYTYKILYLVVPRAWYETWWFRLAVALVFVALFIVSVRLRSASHIRKEREANLIRHYRVISQIIAAVNHDIQTPLHFIGFSLKQFNAYIHRQAAVDPLILRMSDETLNTSQRLNTLTRNILDYIKLQSKSPSERWENRQVNLAALLASTSQLFASIASHRGIDITVNVDPGLSVNSDPNLLSIILHNLIDNALKVSQSEIILSASQVGGGQISISDDGEGIPSELATWLNKKYNSYEDWLRASQNPGQKGIGLVIVKDLAVLLGIDIAVVIEENRTVVLLEFGSMA